MNLFADKGCANTSSDVTDALTHISTATPNNSSAISPVKGIATFWFWLWYETNQPTTIARL